MPYEAPPADLPIGTKLSVRKDLVGMLHEDIDDPRIYYLTVTPIPGFGGRYVKRRHPVPKGTSFTVAGFRRPHHPICHWYSWEVILKPQQPLEPSNAEVKMKLDTAVDPIYMSRGQ